MAALPTEQRGPRPAEDLSRYQHGATLLRQQTEKELAEINHSDLPDHLKSSHRYKACQIAFDSVLEDSKTYRNLLKSIKLSYEEYIHQLENNVQQSEVLSSKLKSLAARPTTFSNLKKRKEQLEKNVERLKKQNQKITDEIEATNKAQYERSLARDSDEKSKTRECKEFFSKVDLPESMEEESLVRYLQRSRRELESLKTSVNEKFITKEEHEDVWSTYIVKTEQKNLLDNTFSDLRKELYFLTVASDAAEKHLDEEPLGKSLSESVYQSLIDALKHSLSQSISGDVLDGIRFQEDETEMTINYIEHFHILMEEQRFEQAAQHAATGPNGVLRNVETFHKFKEAQAANPDKAIMYHYAKAFMSSVLPNFRDQPPTEEMSVSFVQAALKQNDEKSVYHWAQDGILKSSKQVADLLACNKHSKIHGTMVAEDIYMQLGLHSEAIRCMAYRGDIPAAVSFAQHTAGFDKPDYIDLLISVPSVKLARALSVQKSPKTGDVILPCGQVALLLLKDDNLGTAGEFLKTLDLTPRQSSYEELAPNSIFTDTETTEEDWLHIAKMLENTQYEEVGVELITSLSVCQAIETAKTTLSQE